jgi:hypothetical protein
MSYTNSFPIQRQTLRCLVYSDIGLVTYTMTPGTHLTVNYKYSQCCSFNVTAALYACASNGQLHIPRTCRFLMNPVVMVQKLLRFYTERYPQYRCPNPYTFNGTVLWFWETGSACPSIVGCRRWRSVRTGNVEEHILRQTEENLRSSIK